MNKFPLFHTILFSKNFWFGEFLPHFTYYYLIIIFLVWLFILSMFFMLVGNGLFDLISPLKKVYRRISVYLLVLSILAGIIVVGSITDTLYLCFNLYVLFWIALFVLLLYVTIYYIMRILPKEIEKYNEYQEKLKYLPRKRKKNK